MQRQTLRFTQISKQAVNDVSLIRPTQLHYARRAMFLPSKRKIPRNTTLT